MPLDDYSPHQQKIIKRYYRNQDALDTQRLAELISELYLAEGKKRDRQWSQVATLLARMGLPQSRIDHLLDRRDPALLPAVLKELESNPGK
jgi:hypothetical protein